MLRVAMSNEPARDKRQRLEEARVRLLDEHLNPIYLDAVHIDREAVHRLDAPNYYELYKRFGFRLDEVAAECRALLDETEKLWEHEGDKLFRSRLGIGHMGVTEGWAMLMQHLVTDSAWLSRRLDVPRVDDLARDGAVSLLYFVRRYSAKLLYEIEFFQAEDVLPMRSRYAEILGDALRLTVNPESYLDDIDGSFYVTGYLRSWAFEAQLRDFLRGELGSDWFAKRDAGDLLRELWSLGQGPTADELLRDVTGAKLEMASVTDRIREGL